MVKDYVHKHRKHYILAMTAVEYNYLRAAYKNYVCNELA